MQATALLCSLLIQAERIFEAFIDDPFVIGKFWLSNALVWNFLSFKVVVYVFLLNLGCSR